MTRSKNDESATLTGATALGEPVFSELMEFLPSCGATQHEFTDGNASKYPEYGEGASERDPVIFCRNCGEVRRLVVRS